MEKRVDTDPSALIRIGITGPECTGKSTLAAGLAAHYHTVFIPEYAREYIESLHRPYSYDDVVHIAERQVMEEKTYALKANGILFYDTYLIITKVWFSVVYNRMPVWIDEVLKKKHIHLFLLCDTDIPWVPDKVRENGGEMRERLFQMYRQELEKYGFRYSVIRGKGNGRLLNAIEAVESELHRLTQNT
jgi:NadR type nicotinamide-nucleotide adenylyltransferase